MIYSDRKANPLNDPLNDVEDDEGMDDGEEFEGFEGGNEKEENEIIKKLEEQASMRKEKTKRKQSEREREWIDRLVGRWGENYGKMARDRRLNPMQQTEPDIRRRVEKWRAERGSVAVEV